MTNDPISASQGVEGRPPRLPKRWRESVSYRVICPKCGYSFGNGNGDGTVSRCEAPDCGYVNRNPERLYDEQTVVALLRAQRRGSKTVRDPWMLRIMRKRREANQ